MKLPGDYRLKSCANNTNIKNRYIFKIKLAIIIE